MTFWRFREDDERKLIIQRAMWQAGLACEKRRLHKPGEGRAVVIQPPWKGRAPAPGDAFGGGVYRRQLRSDMFHIARRCLGAGHSHGCRRRSHPLPPEGAEMGVAV